MLLETFPERSSFVELAKNFNVIPVAAKILAEHPNLKPADVIDIVRSTADKTADGRRTLINPKKALAAALARKAA